MDKYQYLNREAIGSYISKPGRYPLLPEVSEQGLVALLCRIAYREGWNEHLAGHITWRLADGRILSNPWELAWDEVTEADILTLSPEGEVISGEWNITPAIGLHLQIHAARPDAHVVMHNHPQWSGIWACLGETPPALDQASAYVDGPLPVFSEYDGTFDDLKITGSLVEAIGDAKWALLANHGALVLAENPRQAHLRMATLEWRSMRAWQARLADGGRALPEAMVAQIALPDSNGFPFLFEAMARRELRQDPGILNGVAH
ncbi:class II aldolase/adducin family protein [Parahaliea sp. F7430]|uniref:Class II aldolase/adducin family protein n=1 Tax=Sediminihaliea albiluteola TaxID=2758564 RepID=A0A7W2TXG5_9GAMM|nr:class II aldolase/adducin family protein [Sediminihaliea albiluteola]MBA6413702.1 class II aldolase/adducin family protein [Sediminihaliea albiluteola]